MRNLLDPASAARVNSPHLRNFAIAHNSCTPVVNLAGGALSSQSHVVAVCCRARSRRLTWRGLRGGAAVLDNASAHVGKAFGTAAASRRRSGSCSICRHTARS